MSGKFDKIADIILILSIFYPYNFKLFKVILRIVDSTVFVLITTGSLIASRLVMPQVISTDELCFYIGVQCICSTYLSLS